MSRHSLNLTTKEQCVSRFDLIGSDYVVKTMSGQQVKYLNLDNAATTPPFRAIGDKLNEFLETYGSIHRGSGIKSQISTAIFLEAHRVILDFLDARPDEYSVVITHNTTSAVNKLARMLNLTKDDSIFISEFEHSANDLPWRKGSRIVRIPASHMGLMDLEYIENELRKDRTKGRRIVAISGASNITGALTPIHNVASLAHRFNAIVVVDAAQLVAHREIDLRGKRPGEQIDFIVFSGHKMYAPYGGGALVGRSDLVNRMVPDDVGGGTVDFVTHKSYDLAKDPYKRTTAGTPNVLGLLAMALSCVILKKHIGFNVIVRHEQEILNRAQQRLSTLEGVRTYGDLDYDANKKSAILAFNIDGVHPDLVAVRLAHEFGIGVRQGAMCQFMYVAKILGLEANDMRTARRAALAGKTDRMFGIVRASFGLDNEPGDVDRLAEALIEIVRTPEQSQRYCLNDDGQYWPVGQPPPNGSNFFDV